MQLDSKQGAYKMNPSFPKVLFQQPSELAVVAKSGLVGGDPATFLMALGWAQVASGVGALILRGRPLLALLGCQAAGLVLLQSAHCF